MMGGLICVTCSVALRRMSKLIVRKSIRTTCERCCAMDKTAHKVECARTAAVLSNKPPAVDVIQIRFVQPVGPAGLRIHHRHSQAARGGSAERCDTQRDRSQIHMASRLQRARVLHCGHC
mmetsp:Transcript_54534/g.130078  ORF Transcript_54534/g.130078 Transcript_54534/m.130078 type:complete len:120 (+) Transcript_54534:2671-3030(+)